MKRRIASCAVAVGVTAALSIGAPSAQAAPSGSTPPAASAVHQDLAKLSITLEKRLGARSAGSYLDKATGKLTVTITDGSAAQSVRAAGAIPRVVARSGADLRRATEELDRSARIPGTAWAVDPATNQVVISADESVTGAKLARLTAVAKKLGAAARVEPVNGKLSALAIPVMKDGTAIYTGSSRCSLGFNVFPIGQAGHPGPHYFLTAGHCTRGGSTWYANKNSTGFLGHNWGSSGVFGPGGDYGIVRYEADAWIFGTVADTVTQKITGAGDAFVGESVWRHGSTTGSQEGTVTALNATVNYSGGPTVSGLIKTTVCAEPGDSGGPLYTAPAGIGLGLTSGGSGNCSSGGITFFQPIVPVMQNYGLEMWD